MKKTASILAALALTAGISGQAFAAEGAASFSDVPEGHWSYGAIDQLVKDGILEGNGDGTFAGDRAMSRYEMAAVIARAQEKLKTANPADEALIEKLANEYQAELVKMDEKNEARYEELKSKIDKVQLSGFVRAKYDSDSGDKGVGSQNNNKHFYMDLEGSMKVGDKWTAHFQSETRKGYTVNQSWRKNSRDDDQDGTFQRIWVEGNAGKLGVTVGTKWWGYGFQNVSFGHAADGVQLSYDFAPNWNIKGFGIRPRQGDLVSMPDGQDTHIYGASVTGKLGHSFDAALTFMGNKDYKGRDGDRGDQKMSRLYAIDLGTNLNKDLRLTGTYTRTNAEAYRSSREIRLDYRNLDMEKVGSWNLYTRIFNFERYGDVSHDDEWGSLPADTRGWLVGFRYVPYKDVVWETFYSDQKQNCSGTSEDMKQKAKRHLFRTQLDFHF